LLPINALPLATKLLEPSVPGLAQMGLPPRDLKEVRRAWQPTSNRL